MPSCTVEDCDTKHYAKGYCEKHYNRWRRWGDANRVEKVPYLAISNQSPERRMARLMAKVQVAPDGCWNWTGTKTSAGYGQMRGGPKKKVYTHRVSYELHVGPIPNGLQIDHLCRNHACCNPKHLEPVPNIVNARRGIRLMQTQCPNGHPYSGDNLHMSTNGWRVCRECQNASGRRSRARRRVEKEALPVILCGVPCPYGGMSSWRKHSNVDMGMAWHCNRQVSAEGERCWQHRDVMAEEAAVE